MTAEEIKNGNAEVLNKEIVDYWDKDVKELIEEGKIVKEIDAQCFLNQKIQSLIDKNDHFLCYNNIMLKSRQGEGKDETGKRKAGKDFDIVIFKYIEKIQTYLQDNPAIQRTPEFYEYPKYYPAIVIEMKYPQAGASFTGIETDIARVSSLFENTYLETYAEPKILHAHVLFIVGFSETENNKKKFEIFKKTMRSMNIKSERLVREFQEPNEIKDDSMRKRLLLAQILAYKNSNQRLEVWAKGKLYIGRISLSKNNNNT
ncbi:MAG: hypothetical protein NTY10_01505 [Candidatus Omnitrophica bacterium]|nr:hypothetical protein [Candidatus Omnitrophota bacterium]